MSQEQKEFYIENLVRSDMPMPEILDEAREIADDIELIDEDYPEEEFSKLLDAAESRGDFEDRGN